ncbi:hypothetical protein V1517DRAFT_365334 [Lipomyces orientalis]|uniref:Uncharacterized protein n=1 Tax=Lipomyces orientalis TaxID=1233043 RepID=A0ACC3TVQ9_9ASCO
MVSQFINKVYLVTGAASGMGLATAETLLKLGARLALCDINESSLEKVVDELDSEQRSRTFAQVVDVTDQDAVRNFLEKTKLRFGKLDGVANFAGTGGHGLGSEPIWETCAEEYEFILNLNVKGLFNILTKALSPGFLAQGASVVHIGSMFSLQGFKNGAVFAASKHAALGMVRSAAKETGERVRVNCILPGVIDTPMHRANLARVKDFTPTPTTPIPRSGSAQEVAEVTVFLLSDESSFVTGVAWSVDGGANA